MYVEWAVRRGGGQTNGRTGGGRASQSHDNCVVAALADNGIANILETCLRQQVQIVIDTFAYIRDYICACWLCPKSLKIKSGDPCRKVLWSNLQLCLENCPS